MRICSMEEAARLSSLSVETLLRHHRDRSIVLAPRRLGMRVRDALMLSHKKLSEIRKPQHLRRRNGAAVFGYAVLYLKQPNRPAKGRK